MLSVVFGVVLFAAIASSAAAVAGLLVGLAALITAVGGTYVGIRNLKKLNQNAADVVEARAQVQEIHFMVDGRLTDSLARVAKLEEMLTAERVALPIQHPNEFEHDMKALDE